MNSLINCAFVTFGLLQELDCFLLDENGYVVLSDISWEVSIIGCCLLS